jgi:phage repressor protein C with HTH and peptisase S24 domain
MQGELIDRIKQRLDDLNLTPRELSKRAHLGQDFVSELLRGRKQNVRSDNLDRMARVLETSTQWLLSGSDSPAPLPDFDTSGQPMIPEVDVRAGAGGFADPAWEYQAGGTSADGGTVTGLWSMPPHYLRGELRVHAGHLRIIEVMGDSMAPTLMPHDRILVDISHKAPSPPGVYVLWDGFGMVVKRLEIVHGTDPLRVVVSSDNPNHAERELTVDEAHVQGRVVARVTGV